MIQHKLTLNHFLVIRAVMTKPVSIVADIGGTNARFAYVEQGRIELHNIDVLSCCDYPFLIDAVRSYMKRNSIVQVEKICLAVAAPIVSDWVEMSNNHWAFSRGDLQAELGVEVVVINDFTAQVLALDGLSESELLWLGPARPCGDKVRAVIGPGTGLGMSAMMADGSVVASEGGHIDFAPTTPHETKLLEQLWRRYDRVSIERVLSGVGLENLYWANSCLKGKEKILTAPEISKGAFANDVDCINTVNDFFNILGSVAGDLALMMGSGDGVYITGGIVPRLLHLMDEDVLRQRFNRKGRYDKFCGQTPLAIILSEYPGLTGCVQGLKKQW
jgi:glucokinase